MPRSFLTALTLLGLAAATVSAQRVELLLEGVEPRATVRLAHEAIVHGLRVELIDAGGEVTSDVAWSAALVSIDATGATGIVSRFNGTSPELQIPRPYGLRLAADDSLTIVGTLAAAEIARGMRLRLVVDYELPAVRTSRLPVTPLATHAANVSADSEESWTWQPAVDGRLVAISGRELAGAESLVLEDAATGAVLWHTRAERPHVDRAASSQGELVRPGVTLEGGRAYRLRAVFAQRSGARAATDSAPLAVVMPSRRPGL